MYFLLILFVGILLRFISLNQSLWLDEATSALAAKMSLTNLFTKFLPADFHPPLYYLLLHFWVQIFGSSEIALRIPSVIFGVLTICVVYKISKNLVAPLLTATSGLLIYYSQEARMYSLAALLVSSSVYLFIRKKYFWLSIVLLPVGMTDYVSLLVIPVLLLSDIRNWKKLFASLWLLALGFVFWGHTFIAQLVNGLSVKSTSPAWWNILGQDSVKNIGLIPVKFMLGRVSFDNKIVYSLIVFIVLLLVGYILYFSRKAAKIYWLWLVAPVLLGIVISFKIPTLSYFRFIFCLPVLYILISKSSVKKIFIYFIVVINLLTSCYYLLTPRFWREDWRSVAIAIGRDAVIVPADSQKEALIYYGKTTQIVDAKDLSDSQNEIWLSRYVSQVFDPTDVAQKKVLSLGYNKAGEYNFNGVVLWKYKKI